MDGLSMDAVGAHIPVAVERVHRYEIAARLCKGLRVADVGCATGYGAEILRRSAQHVHGIDGDAPAIETARATVGRATGVEFEVADPAEFLQRDLVSDFDALVVFETLERLPSRDAVWKSVCAQAAAGMRIVVSMSNSAAPGPENAPQQAAVGFEEAMDLFSQLDDVVVAYQFDAEGSLVGIDADSEPAGQVTLVDRAESPYANHFLAFVNFGGQDAIVATIGGRMQLNAAPVHNRYLRHLEAAYRELVMTNARLARQWLGSSDAAAARRVDELEERLESTERRAETAEAAVRERDARIAEMERVMVSVWNSFSWRITRPLRTAKDRIRARLGR